MSRRGPGITKAPAVAAAAWPECPSCGGHAAPVGAAAVSVTFDVETRSEANARERWGRAKRSEAAKEATAEALATVGAAVFDARATGGPWLVLLTRLSPGELDDDNLGGALKAVRDVVAAHLGVDDKSPRIAWKRAQAHRRALGVRIEIWSAGGQPS